MSGRREPESWLERNGPLVAAGTTGAGTGLAYSMTQYLLEGHAWAGWVLLVDVAFVAAVVVGWRRVR